MHDVGTARARPPRRKAGPDRAAPAAERDPGQPGAEHPFAPFVRAVGKGAKLSRSLEQAEAAQAMRMILAGDIDPVQLGAFLVILRYRKETPAELAGFVEAAREAVAEKPRVAVDLDWPSYADRHRQLPYFVLAALLLADNGVRVLMHGIAGEGSGGTRACLAALGVEPAHSSVDAARRLDATNFAYLPLEQACPGLAATVRAASAARAEVAGQHVRARAQPVRRPVPDPGRLPSQLHRAPPGGGPPLGTTQRRHLQRQWRRGRAQSA